MSTRRGPRSARSNTVFLLALLAVILMVAAACGDSTETSETGASAAGESTGDESGEMSEMSDMADGEDTGGAHDHGQGIEIPDGMAVPTVAVSAEPDSSGGHNLFIELTDFAIAPERASTEPVDGEGHLHLYVDGERVMRFYNTAVHLSGVEPGDHTVEIELSANNHSAYSIDGEPIRAKTTITVAEESAGGHHGHGDDSELFESAVQPAVAISIEEDPKSGWNLRADVENFSFAPESVGAAAVDGEGHLHLYVDGEKVTRMYGPWWHLSGLGVGEHEIMVEMSANDHSVYAIDGEPVVAMATLTVSEAQAEMAMSDGDHGDDDHGHSHLGTGEYTDGSADADVVIAGSFIDGELEIDDRRFSVDNGQIVGLRFTSDVDEFIHVHGYDVLLEVGPDNPIDVSFVADLAGSYEVEFENTGRFLFDLQVSQ